MKTRADAVGLELVIDEPDHFDFSKASEFCGFICQNPDNLGTLKDLSNLSTKLKE
jgi:hypothetical protein